MTTVATYVYNGDTNISMHNSCPCRTETVGPRRLPPSGSINMNRLRYVGFVLVAYLFLTGCGGVWRCRSARRELRSGFRR